MEDDPYQKFTSTRKAYEHTTPKHLLSETKKSICAKEFLAIILAFQEFGQIFCGTPQPVFTMTDSKSVARFFQTIMIPSLLWNACDVALPFIFTIAHFPGKMITAPDFLSRLDFEKNEKRFLKIREDFPTQPIEVNIESTAIAQEDPVFFPTDDVDLPCEEQLWQHKWKKTQCCTHRTSRYNCVTLSCK